MKIQVLGSGCPTCKKLYQLTKQAVVQLSLSVEVDYITDVQQIIKLGLMQSPVLAVNDQPIIVGAVPSVEEIKTAINQALTSPRASCCQSSTSKCQGKC